jgi:phosphoribosylformylglycinamidine (FGAM) synthase-like enzyme
LNFGNPYKPENFWQLREAVEGIAEACRAFGTPVTGGNVSLYNESQAGVIDPTPTIGMVGLIDAEAYITTQCFKKPGDVIILVGDGTGSDQQPIEALGASRFLKVCFGLKQGPVPALDLEREIAVQNVVRDLIRENFIRSAHDCSDGGLAVALAECCFNPERLLGAEIKTKASNSRNGSATAAAATLFNEAQSRIVISVAPENREKAVSKLKSAGLPHQVLGTVTTTELRLGIDQETFSWPIADLYDDWWNAIRRAVEKDESIPSL